MVLLGLGQLMDLIGNVRVGDARAAPRMRFGPSSSTSYRIAQALTGREAVRTTTPAAL